MCWYVPQLRVNIWQLRKLLNTECHSAVEYYRMNWLEKQNSYDRSNGRKRWSDLIKQIIKSHNPISNCELVAGKSIILIINYFGKHSRQLVTYATGLERVQFVLSSFWIQNSVRLNFIGTVQFLIGFVHIITYAVYYAVTVLNRQI